MIRGLMLSVICLSLLSCTAVSITEPKQYVINGISSKRLVNSPSRDAIYVSPVSASAGYETNDMIYSRRALEVSAFVNNEWIAPPAKMLRPVIISSLQNTGYFKAVLNSGAGSEPRFKLNVSVLTFSQNFIQNPSQVNLTLKADLIDIKRSKVIASKRFIQKRITQFNTPYSGVISFNQATKAMMAQLSKFVVNSCQSVS